MMEYTTAYKALEQFKKPEFIIFYLMNMEFFRASLHLMIF
jgi:hypothetical protein